MFKTQKWNRRTKKSEFRAKIKFWSENFIIWNNLCGKWSFERLKTEICVYWFIWIVNQQLALIIIKSNIWKRNSSKRDFKLKLNNKHPTTLNNQFKKWNSTTLKHENQLRRWKGRLFTENTPGVHSDVRIQAYWQEIQL